VVTVPDPLLLRNLLGPGIGPETSGSVARNSDNWTIEPVTYTRRVMQRRINIGIIASGGILTQMQGFAREKAVDVFGRGATESYTFF
jgi:hypothetical protein